jgi:hypothetical protein
MSSYCSVRCTTAPGVIARSLPTSNAPGGTIEGTRGFAARSDTSARRPRSTLTPRLSAAAFQWPGLSSGLLLGALAAMRLVSTNRRRVSSRQSSSAPSSSACADWPAAR